ncbi:hypothetical protein CMI48_04155 [Candidatus Pacearchaeota archaeon]|nr:hypothetical protein [Candidatus Pacearchaeota archaeon]
MFEDLFNLAFTNLKKRGIRSWLTMLGIFIGIAAVVSLISLGQGLQTAITGQFSSLDPDKLIVQNAETGFGPPGALAVQKLNAHDVGVIEKVNGVDLIVERLIRVVTVEHNDITNFHYIGSLPEDPDELAVIYESINVKPLEGRLLRNNDARSVIVGHDFTKADEDFEKPIRIGSSINIQNQSFDVVGILEQASTFQLNSVVFMMEEDMKDLLEIDDEVDMLLVQVKDQDQIIKVAENIKKALRKDRKLDPGEEDFTVQTPEQAVSTINTILLMINIIVVGIAMISLVVGGIGIANTMYTSVLERRKEIGVMKAVGAKNQHILTIFLIESALLGLAGGLIGAAIGLGLAFGAAAAVQTAMPGLAFGVSISYPLLTAAILFSLIIGALAGIFPALQAARMTPVEALRS